LKIKTKDLVLAALLVALSIIIPQLAFLRIPIPPTTVTISAHVPTIIAMFVNPVVAVCAALGSALGFFIAVPDPTVPLRALTHIFFALAGAFMVRKRVNIFTVAFFTMLIHAFLEVFAVSVFVTVVAEADAKFTVDYIWKIVGGFTAGHHIADFIISFILLKALNKAKFIGNI